MAFRTQYSSLGNLERAYRSIQDAYASVRRFAVLARGRMNAPVNADDLMQFLRDLTAKRVRVDGIIAGVDTTALLAHVRTIEVDPTYDVVAEYTAMRTAALAVQTAIWAAWDGVVWEEGPDGQPRAVIIPAAGFLSVVPPNSASIASLVDTLISTIEAPVGG